MEKLLKVLWILVVYLIHISSCDLKSDFIKQFKYLENDDIYDIFPRRHTINSNSIMFGVKCPRGNITIPNVDLKDHKQVDFETVDNHSPSKWIYEKKESKTTEWIIFDYKEIESSGYFYCLQAELIKNTSLEDLFSWAFKIRHTTEHLINIVKEGYLNVAHHIPGQKIYNKGFEEKTIAFSTKNGYRVFDFKTTNLYKGDTLVTFNNSNFYNEDIEFQEPFGIAKINHPPPYISIDDNLNISINYNNKDCWLVESDFFPITFYIKLLYNGTTNQPGFFDYENVNVSYLRYSRDNKLEEIKNEILIPSSNNNRSIVIRESVIVKFQYNCDDCVDGGVNVVQNMLIGKNFDFEDKVLPSIGYYYDKLHFNANCSMSHNIFTQLKTVSFNDEKVEVEAFYKTSDNSIGNFKLDNDVVLVTNKNSSGILICTYIYPFGEFKTSQMYESFKDEEMPLITYYRDKLLTKPKCSRNQNNSAILTTVLFDNERIEIDDLKDRSSGTKGNFKYNGTLVTFTGTNPNGKLSCFYKLTYGEVSRNETYKFFSNQTLPFVTYPYGELPIKPNCFKDQVNSTNLKSVLFNDELIEVDDLKSATGSTIGNFKMEGKTVIFIGNHPKGTLTCIYKLFYGEYSVNQEYEYFETTNLPEVKYALNHLSFKANCSVELKTNVILKTILFKDETIEINDLKKSTDNVKGNFKLGGNYVTYMDKNPVGKCVCIYKLSFGEISISQTYESFTDESKPLITYRHDGLLPNPSCSIQENNFTILKTVIFNNERTEVGNLQTKIGNEEGNFKLNGTSVAFTDTNPNGDLSCIYQLHYGKISKNQTYKSFKDQNFPPLTYLRGELRLTPNCPMGQGDSVNLQTVSFNGESVEVNDLKSRSDKRKGNFKSDGKFVNFMGTNPKGKLSCIFKLSYGEFSTNQPFEYFSNKNHPIIRYAFNQLVIRPNCSMEAEKNVNLKTILYNDESVEGEYLQNTVSKSKDNFKLEGGSIFFTGDNPKGKCTCVYKLSYGELKTFQEYQSIENTILPEVIYAQDQLNFHPNCSREENLYTKLKTIVLDDKRIEVEGLDDVALSQMGNIKTTKKLIIYTVKNPEGKLSCVYKVPIGEIEKFQNYKSISNETHPVVEYSYKRLGYKANCSRHLNSFTHLRGIRFKDDKTTVVSLQRSRVGALGRLKLEKDFVINTEKNPNGTLFCLYDVPIGEVLVTKKFLTFETDDEENSSNKMRYAASMILGYMIVISMII